MDNDTGENDKLTQNESHPLNARSQQRTSQFKKDLKSYNGVTTNMTITKEPKKTTLMSVTRLQIPNTSRGYQRLDNSPLLHLESDSEDELFLSYNAGTPSANQVNKQLTRQLEKDGYRLDEMPDDEELDLIPPREFREARFCSCCNAFKISCAIM